MIRRVSTTLALAATLAVPAAAQQRAADFHWQGILAAGGTVSVNNINGDVKVVPSTTGRVEVLGFKHGESAYFDRVRVDVQPTPRGITVCVLFENDRPSCIDDRDEYDNRGRGRREWRDLSINLEVAVPPNLMVSANSVSGDVDVSGAQGDVRVGSVSGDVRLSRLVASSIEATTVSGDIAVRVDRLTGRGDLDFKTVSGDVTIEVPKQFDADVTMSTVSGDIESDFQLLVSGSRMNRRSLDARIGNGGRRLDLKTVSGDVRIRSVN